MTREARIVIAIAGLGSTLLAATLVRAPARSAPFAAAAAEANDASAPTSAYDIFLALTPEGDRAGGIAQLKRAIKLQADGEYAAAVDAYDDAAERLPQIADWITVFAASSAARLGDTAQVKRRLGSVDDVLAKEWAWRTRALAYEHAGARNRAIEAATAATTAGSAGRRAAAWYYVAELQRDAGNTAARREALLEAMATTSEADAVADAARELLALGDLTAGQRVAAARALMRNGAVTSGARVLEEVLSSDALREPERSETRYELARVLFSVNRFQDAAEQIKRVAPGSERAADARFLLARTYARQDKAELSKRTFNSVVADYPTSRAATRALFMLADLAQDEGDMDDATAFFSRTAAAPARADETAEALMRIGGIAFARADYDAAGTTFDSYRARFTSGEYHHQAMYWSALSKMRSGDTAAGEALLRDLRNAAPLSYYGIRAAAILGESPLDAGLDPAPVTTETTRHRVEKGLARWALLDEVGWHDAASFELRRLRRHFSGNRAALYEIAEQLQKRSAPHLAIGIGRDLLDNGASWDKRLLKIMYPLPYRKLIQQHASSHGLDPYFVTALIRQESRFNRNAMSGAGAVGLMQVLPSTGKQLRKKTRSGKITVAKLTQPDINLTLGTKFLADLMDMYDNRLDAVLVAYNAGPSRAYRWRNFPEFGSEDLFVERIPFDETRAYVKAIKVNLAIYHALYRDKETAD